MVTFSLIVFYIGLSITNTTLGTSVTSTIAFSSSSAITHTSIISETIQTSSRSISLLDPAFKNGTIAISYPADYDVLATYALELINKDRAGANLPPVTLSPIPVGQQHANSMLYHGYFSHWDIQGYKPYMRYTLMNGTGSMSENIAYEYISIPYYLNTGDVKQAIARLEYQMIHNDTICCQDGHRKNILSPLHNRVSIGIAYNQTHVYLVQDFENQYIDLSRPVILDNSVKLFGESSIRLELIQLLVYYDSYPKPLDKIKLNAYPYASAYDQGNFIGGVVPPCKSICYEYPGYITIQAQIWDVSSTSINIEFQLTEFIQRHGMGVYTIYVRESSNFNPLFSKSIFVEG
jgi:uncharacterized protein YkwD